MNSTIATIFLTTGLASTVLAQTTSDRLLWSFQTDDRSTRQFITLADDGTIYTADNSLTYALSPTGDLIWATPDASGDAYGARPIALGPDGTLYTGVGQAAGEIIVALNPDGSRRWAFTTDTNESLAGGPGVGPDGNVYAVQENTADGGLGIFSLMPDGDLRWSSAGAPSLTSTDVNSNSEIVFGDDRLHVGVLPLRSGAPIDFTLNLDGDLLWSTSDLDVHTTTFPVLDPNQRVILSWGQTGVRALSPDGQEEWFTLHSKGASVMLRPAIGASGDIYAGDSIGIDLWALDPDGHTKWVRPSTESTLLGLAVSPDERVIVAYGGGGFGEDGWIRGYSAQDGAELWTVDLIPEEGLFQYATTYRPVFTPDSSTVYLTTQFVGAGVGHGYVLAIDITDGSCRADLDADGALTIFDFLTFQNLFDAGSSEADFDGDGDLTIFDFLAFQNGFDDGCA